MSSKKNLKLHHVITHRDSHRSGTSGTVDIDVLFIVVSISVISILITDVTNGIAIR